MQTLYLNDKFLNSLKNDPKVIRTLRIYGYDNSDEFIEDIKNKLNDNYDFIKINNVLPFETEHNNVYSMYNGFIIGDIGEYKEITVSFSVMKDGKLGNVFVTQQLVPMITSKLSSNINFLKDKKIKKIFLLTTHLSKKMTPLENKIKNHDSTGSMVIKILNVLGFDVLEMFPIGNSNVQSTYNSLEEFVDHSNYINRSKSINTNYNHVQLINDKVILSFEENEKVEGQTIKFVLLKALAAIELSDGRFVDLSNLIYRTGLSNKNNPARNVVIVADYSEYIFNNKDKFASTSHINRRPSYIESESKYHSPIIKTYGVAEHLVEPEYTFNSNGKKVFKTFREKKAQSFETHNYICSCHDDRHKYFTSSTTLNNYVEGHHMIPMEFQVDYWKDYKVNLDSTLNIIPLCPNCHQKIHKAIKSERIEIIMEVYKKYEESLKTLDERMNLEKFASLYNVYIY
jgi:hypothetical protein